MSQNQPNLLELAQQGDAKAIAVLLNRSLQSKGITAKVARENDCLQIVLESAQAPDQDGSVSFINCGVAKLGAESIRTLRVSGKSTHEDFLAWTREVQLQAATGSNFTSKNEHLLQNNSSSGSSLKIPIEQVPTAKPKKQLKWFETESPILTVALLVLFFPLGLWSMWKYAQWKPNTKGMITAAVAVFAFVAYFNQTPRQAPSPATKPSPEQRVLVGLTKTGQEIWTDKKCLYIKGMGDADFARLHTDVWEFKKELKAQTGYSCVFFE